MSLYQQDNIFAKILRVEIPCKKVFENEFVLAFHDIAPKAPIHILILPKQAAVSTNDFGGNATPAMAKALWEAIPQVAELAGVKESGYRIIANCGGNAHQEVPHLHLHLLAGRPLGAMLVE
ncbi:MAG: histidine triad nucleotide-binding protein [Alphaproteobacteria bacterium]